MPMSVTAVAAAGEVHPNPFVGPINHTVAITVDPGDLSTYEVDTYGYIKPGVLLTRNGELPEPADVLLQIGTLAISATAEKFKTTTTLYGLIGGIQVTKAATDNLTFTAAHVVSASKFGVILVQMDIAGTISTKVPLATQAYDSAALALAALPESDANKLAVGYIAIAAKAATWTANTDDMTNGSDLTTATFNNWTVYPYEENENRAFGAVVEATKIATANDATTLAAAADVQVAVATICMINKAILEDSLGRSLTSGELYNKSEAIVLAY